MLSDCPRDRLVVGTDHNRNALNLGRLQRVQHMRDDRQPADAMQHLGDAGFHPLSLARCEDHGQACAHAAYSRRESGRVSRCLPPAAVR